MEPVAVWLDFLCNKNKCRIARITHMITTGCPPAPCLAGIDELMGKHGKIQEEDEEEKEEQKRKTWFDEDAEPNERKGIIAIELVNAKIYNGRKAQQRRFYR